LSGTRLACDRVGQGPPVVLVHGVGIGPWSYAPLARDLATDHEVVVAHRRGYGSSAGLGPATSLAEQVEDLAGLAGGPAAFVGVSGGATLVLALALASPEIAVAAVVHEPVVGPLAHEIHAELQEAAARLRSSTGEAAALEFVRDLVGPQAWSRLHPLHVADVAARSGVVRAEVPQFLAFSPGPDELAALAGGTVLNSVGELSRSSRHEAAAAVAAHTGSLPVVLRGVGHLAQVEGAGALAQALRDAEHPTFGVAEPLALQGRSERDQEALAARGGDQLKPDG
jgi:pimeloyl-ACP methyl ester carboxylesterase